MRLKYINLVITTALFIGILSIIVPNTNIFAQERITINGAGATFPYPLIDNWRVEYQNVNPNVEINYQSIGSGAGVKQFIEKIIDFGATDAPLTSSEVAKNPEAVHIPETIGSVVVAYNLPSIPEKGLKLTGEIIADIFLGKITKWDDQKIQELNPDKTFPSDDINVVHRSDGSGTTFVWTDYLSSVSQDWETAVGKGKAVAWPVGIGASGNEGVSSNIKSNENTIGYIELNYALTTNTPYAFVQNKEGNFVEPSVTSIMEAVRAQATSLPTGNGIWTNVTLVNAAGQNSYPVASFSYILLDKELTKNPNISEQKAKAMIDFLSWAITEGQKTAQNLNYVPLPEEIVKLNQETIKSLTFNGNPLS